MARTVYVTAADVHAARLRVATDRRQDKTSPPWLIRLAGVDTIMTSPASRSSAEAEPDSGPTARQ